MRDEFVIEEADYLLHLLLAQMLGDVRSVAVMVEDNEPAVKILKNVEGMILTELYGMEEGKE